MPTWNAEQYLKFGDERTQPCRDLVARVNLDSPRRIIDLGCGPGNSTAVVARRWPEADITGLDSSAEMIDAARLQQPARHWIVGDIEQWSRKDGESFDLVFSNAALQWVSEHDEILPRLLGRVSSGGALAFQIPGNYDGPAHRLMRELAASSAWRTWFPEGSIREWFSQEFPFYYDVLAPNCARLDLWLTDYIHILPNAQAIVEWYKGTGLRPFLDLLPEEKRASFMADYLELIRTAFPPQPDSKVLFPFRRLFAIAYR
ncbi:MAG TPA: methyltransferase domain-containing protein [Tepidisphaeraceae bacterium]|nr:methyltransferase domain-containing protein [Tepidisphaeraceae bacterium]